MNTIILLLQVLVVLGKVGFVITGSLLAAFTINLWIDDRKAAREERDRQAGVYQGRHRFEEQFIHDLVEELRENPNSLCYAHAESWA